MDYPIGIQTFPKIINENYLYIDKTAHIYELVRKPGYYFLSRPRRFGKSLLLSTIESYFRGEKELFKGLAIETLAKSWDEHPVLHLDLNAREYSGPDSLRQELSRHLDQWEKIYASGNNDKSVEERFGYVIENACRLTGKKVVILVDEYDKPLLNAINDVALADSYRSTLKAFYGNLKSCDKYIQFAMLTGVARFSKVSIFSDLNNLNDISFLDEFSSLCGISDTEVDRYFGEGIATLAKKFRISAEEVRNKMKLWYDGYHFSEYSDDIYNPFSLMNLFYSKKFDNYWFKTGTPTHVVKLLRSGSWDVRDLSDYRIKASRLSSEGIMSRNPVVTLYQAGYLTISHYNPELAQYTLDYPNREVKESFLEFLLEKYTDDGNQRTDFEITRFVEEIRNGRIGDFMTRISSMVASVPYREKGEVPEAHFQSVVYMIFTLLGFYTEMEDRTSSGRIDITVRTADLVYIFEFKVDCSAQTAMDQIKEKRYWLKFAASGCRIFLIGANFDPATKTISDYLAEELRTGILP